MPRVYILIVLKVNEKMVSLFIVAIPTKVCIITIKVKYFLLFTTHPDQVTGNNDIREVR